MNCIFSIDYGTEIQPIFNTNCISCHSYGSNSFNNHQLNLTSYSGLMSGGGNVIIAGDSTNSLLFQEISTFSMPPYGSGLNLTAYEISLIAQWIAEGAMEQEQLSNSIHTAKFDLQKPYPNPFNPTTSILFSIPKQSQTSIKVLDIKGNLISTLLNESMNVGHQQIEWNAEGYPSGVYFVKLDAGEFTKTQKLMLVK